MKALLNSLNEPEMALVRETGTAELTRLDEDDLADLHTRIRRARDKYSKQYRRTASARVEEYGGRGKARPKNQRNAQKAEVFEDALARVSWYLSRAARRSAAELKAERLAAAGRPHPVLNAGIGSNKLLTDSACGGDSGISRFARDVLDQPRVGTAIVLIGINDIQLNDDRMCGVDLDDPPVTAQRLIDGHQALVRAALARGVAVIGGTLTPFEGSAGWTAEGEEIRRRVNRWIRTSGAYDAVADFDRALDPDGTGRIPEALHMGDHIHPSAAGYRAMADAIDPADLKHGFDHR